MACIFLSSPLARSRDSRDKWGLDSCRTEENGELGPVFSQLPWYSHVQYQCTSKALTSVLGCRDKTFHALPLL